MSDICEISRLSECMKEGAHDPVVFPEDEDSVVPLAYGKVNFGGMRACKRCGLMYWEPLPPPLVLEAVDDS